MPSLDLSSLSDTDFEEFCYELLGLLGFVNVDWRKGTPLTSSPSDRGRDIVAELLVDELDGSQHLQQWFIECKHYGKGVPPAALAGALAWAGAERPHTLLIIASGYLSNPCKDYLDIYVQNNRPPYRIKRWEAPQLDTLAGRFPDFLAKYGVGGLRSVDQVIDAEQEFGDRAWFAETINLGNSVSVEDLEEAFGDLGPEENEEARRLVDLYGLENLGPYTEFELGLIKGKLSALRWVLGSEWDVFGI